jgi:hypothetical protein
MGVGVGGGGGVEGEILGFACFDTLNSLLDKFHRRSHLVLLDNGHQGYDLGTALSNDLLALYLGHHRCRVIQSTAG